MYQAISCVRARCTQIDVFHREDGTYRVECIGNALFAPTNEIYLSRQAVSELEQRMGYPPVCPHPYDPKEQAEAALAQTA